jgi:hypothetical protein
MYTLSNIDIRPVKNLLNNETWDSANDVIAAHSSKSMITTVSFELRWAAKDNVLEMWRLMMSHFVFDGYIIYEDNF